MGKKEEVKTKEETLVIRLQTAVVTLPHAGKPETKAQPGQTQNHASIMSANGQARPM